MREMYDLLEYLLDREVHAVVDLVEAVKRGENREKIIEALRILQGDLMTLRTVCAWMRGRYRCIHCGKETNVIKDGFCPECFEKIIGKKEVDSDV